MRRRNLHVAGVVVPLLLVVLAIWLWGRTPSAASVVARGAGVPTDRVVAVAPTPRAPVTTSPSRPTPHSTSDSTPHSTSDSTPRPTSDSTPGPTPRATGTPTTGPGLTEPGIRLEAQASSDGGIQVSERARLPKGAVTLRLVSPDLTTAGSTFTDARPRARGIRLTVDGRPVALAASAVGASQTIRLPRGATSYVLRYVLTGATVRSVPSRPGRALAALTPLSRPAPGTPVVVTTRGDSVLNLVCPLLGVTEVACSNGVRGRMAVRDPLPAPDALVVLQLELAKP